MGSRLTRLTIVAAMLCAIFSIWFAEAGPDPIALAVIPATGATPRFLSASNNNTAMSVEMRCISVETVPRRGTRAATACRPTW